MRNGKIVAVLALVLGLAGVALADISPMSAPTGTQRAFLTSVVTAGAQTAAQILALLVTVDGAGSTLDADSLDGISSAGFQALTSGRAALSSQNVTCSSNGTPATPGTLTVDPTASIVYLTNSDVDGCAVTLDEQNAVANTEVTIIVVSNAGGLVVFADVTNVLDAPTLCAVTGIGLRGIFRMIYTTNTYVGLSCLVN